jgi:DNA-directed RNA polymerase subunit D
MDISLDKKHGNRIEFTVKGTTAHFANTVRRYSMMRIPVLAFEKITFYENSSAFWDEYISHRIGLMPVVTPSKLPKNAEVEFYLEAEGPCIVYSKDFKSDDKNIKIAKENIPIITLGEKQRIKVEGKTALGRGIQHARFQAGLVSYGIEGDKFSFFVESFFQMEPADVIKRGCDEILDDISALRKELK